LKDTVIFKETIDIETNLGPILEAGKEQKGQTWLIEPLGFPLVENTWAPHVKYS
jgi:hypothetical protein